MLHFRTDRTDPKPILTKSWKPAEGKERWPHARAAVIAFGEGQGTILHVCIAKNMRETLGKPKAANQSIPTDAEIEAEARQEAAWAGQREAEERWRTELRPRALRLRRSSRGRRRL